MQRPRARFRTQWPACLCLWPFAYSPTNMTPKRFQSVWLLALVLVLPFPRARGAPSSGEILPPGFRPQPVGVHALVGGKVVTKPGETLDGANIVIRDGYIEAVGRDVTARAD